MSQNDLSSEPVFEAYVGAPCERELHQALTKIARRNDRSLAAEIRRALRRHVERETPELPAATA